MKFFVFSNAKFNLSFNRAYFLIFKIWEIEFVLVNDVIFPLYSLQ